MQDVEVFDGPAMAAEVCETIRKIEASASWSKHFNHQAHSRLGALHHCTSMRACLDEIAAACEPATSFTPEEESVIQEALQVEEPGSSLDKLWKTPQELGALQDPEMIEKDRDLLAGETTNENLEETIKAGFRTLDRIELGFQPKPWENYDGGSGAETVQESAAVTPTELEITTPKSPKKNEEIPKEERDEPKEKADPLAKPKANALKAKSKAKAIAKAKEKAKEKALAKAKAKAKAKALAKSKAKAVAKSKAKAKAVASKQKRGSKDKNDANKIKKKRTKKDQEDEKQEKTEDDRPGNKKNCNEKNDESTALKKKMHAALWWH